MRIRSAMQEHDHDYLLQDIIELDEAYLGAPKSGKKRGRSTEREKMAVAVSKDRENKPMFLRLKTNPDITTQTRQNVVDQCVQKGSTIECDGYRNYSGLENDTINVTTYDPDAPNWTHTYYYEYYFEIRNL